MMIHKKIMLNGKPHMVSAPLTSKIPCKVEGAIGLVDKEKVKKFLKKLIQEKQNDN